MAVLEAPKDGQGQHTERAKRYIVEHVDLGSYYYRKYFYLRGEQEDEGERGPPSPGHEMRREKCDIQ